MRPDTTWRPRTSDAMLHVNPCCTHQNCKLFKIAISLGHEMKLVEADPENPDRQEATGVWFDMANAQSLVDFIREVCRLKGVTVR